MWICTNTGFVSVVADRNDPARLLVRARRKIDLQNVVGDADILETPERDYRYRTFIDREKFKQIVVAGIDAITYGNFKNSVPDECGDLHEMYAKFWEMHRSYGKKEPATRKADRSGHFAWGPGDLTLLKRADVKKD
jgi:hypothetical protein